jgi:large subunit ribosomal protein L18
MPHGSRYRVPLRRRREQKTDYQARKAFVVSGRPRLVARSSLKNTVAQIVIAKPHGDEVMASAHSRELIQKYGWKAATGNVPAAYLTGLLCGLKAKKNGVSEAILDLGLVSPTKGSKVFSTLSGVVDAGVTIPHSPEKIIKERTIGYHIQDYAESLGAPEEYKPKFSTYTAKGLSPEKISEHFVEVRNSILTAYGMPIPKTEARPVKAKKPEQPKPKPAKVEKPEAKKVQVVAQAKPEVKPAVAEVEAKKPMPTEVKPKAAPQVAPEAKAPTVETEAKPKAAKAPKAKPATKKAAPAKAKTETPEQKAETETKPKRARKKSETEEPAPKPAKKTGGKKE